MKPSAKTIDENKIQHGLTAFFDILGYKSIIQNNDLRESIYIVKQIEEAIDQAVKRLSATEGFLCAPICKHVVFSDSILVHTVPFVPDPHTFVTDPEQMQLNVFIEFAVDLLNRLLLAGLPVRGALAYGDIYVDTQTPDKILLAGKPIVEAYEWANRLELSACVLAPSAEAYLAAKQVLDTSLDRQMGFIKYAVPMKPNRERQKKFMLDQGSFYKHYREDLKWPEISPQMIVEKFAAHKKLIDDKVQPKIDNTIEFLEACNAPCDPSSQRTGKSKWLFRWNRLKHFVKFWMRRLRQYWRLNRQGADRRERLWRNQQWQNQRPDQTPCLRLVAI